MSEIATNRELLIVQNRALYEAALPFYDPLSEHHSMEGHIFDTWEVARKVTFACIEAGHEINIPILDADVLFHDADWHKPLRSYGFKTKERRSASIARRVIPSLDLGYTPADIGQISSDIISTTNGVIPITREGAVLSYADNFNFGFDLADFLDVSARVAKELFRLNGKTIDNETVQEWLELAPPIISRLLDDEPNVPGFNLDEILGVDSPLRERGQRNIEILGNLSVSKFMELLRGGKD